MRVDKSLDTYKPPRRKIAKTLIFLTLDICSRSTPDMGRAKIKASKRMFVI